MLRVGLTGELGSGKSTVARLLATHGAVVLSSDEMARAMMQPCHPVYGAIVDHFGPSVLLEDGHLDRPTLARLAFHPEHPRVDELNAIIHPAVLAEQERQISDIARTQPHAIVVIESALILTVKHTGNTDPWRERFDLIVLVTAPDPLKIKRYLHRMTNGSTLPAAEEEAIRRDALRRLSAQRVPPGAADHCLLLDNAGDLEKLQVQVDTLWRQLLAI